MIDKVLKFIDDNKLIKKRDLIVVGLSGGPDSICLTYILNELKKTLDINLIAAHLDHQWRSNSADDVLFCQNFTKSLNIPFVFKRASEIQLKKLPCGTSKEAHGRLLRRQFFEDILQENQAHSIALAHHWDDQEETFFLRLIRGATITGLASMKPKNGYYIRPLLEILKKDILNFLQINVLAYIKDETNDSDLFLRNKIRKYILPELHKIDARFDKNFAKTLKHIQQTDEYIEEQVSKIFKSISETKNNIYYINKQEFLNVDKFLQVPLIIKLLCTADVSFVPTETFFAEILRFINQTGSGKHILGNNWGIVKDKEKLYIEKILYT